MNIFARFEAIVATAARELVAEGRIAAPLSEAQLSALAAERPRDASHGDIATNAALVLAKAARMKPRDLAELLAEKLRTTEGVVGVEIAGPGFINLRVADAVWHDVVRAALGEGRDFGRAEIGKGERVNVEYVSANPTGPMHVGHCRGAVFGDALANLLAHAGYAITREYYINDAGAQVDVLARSAYLRYREALGEQIGEIPAGLYPGDYLVPVGQALAAAHGTALLDKPEAAWLPVVREAAVAAMLVMIKEDLAALAVRHDVFFSERSLMAQAAGANANQVETTIDALERKGLIYRGRLERPKGEEVVDWEDREQTLFKATAFGDDTDRALVKSDGSYTYFASDMAYHNDKVGRGFAHLINVFGADHAGYIKRLTAAVKALSDGKVDLDIKVCQLVKLFKGGQPYKMSKRAGTFVTLRDVVDEVGRDPVRFMMLYRKNDAPLDFDFEKVTEKSRDNPVFYVQYAHARAHSLFRMADEAFPGLGPSSPEVRGADLSPLTDEGELALIKRLAFFPRLIEGAALAHEPHRLAFYLYDLAADFHTQWNRGKDLPHLRFIRDDDRRVSAARVALVTVTSEVIASGLAVLGVEAPREMR
ncbi:MAG: arginine--tRNA ligase [Hyphomicrobiaceae bacterium]|nr:arginine--tRNA ligase [Hyphomicrobiaceae bacterium]